MIKKIFTKLFHDCKFEYVDSSQNDTQIFIISKCKCGNKLRVVLVVEDKELVITSHTLDKFAFITKSNINELLRSHVIKQLTNIEKE